MEEIRVLLVEDSRPTRDLLRSYLDRQEGITVCGEACDGAQGLALIETLSPDIVLLALALPVMSGLGLLRALKERTGVRRPRVIVVSSLMAEPIVRTAAALGADYFMPKPVNLAELGDNIRSFCAGDEYRGDVRAAVELLEQMGAPHGALGCRYAALTAAELAEDETGCMLLKQAYIPAMEEGRTQRQNVEKNIRDVIEKIHRLGTPAYAELMGGLPKRRPDNRDFLTNLARAVRRGVPLSGPGGGAGAAI